MHGIPRRKSRYKSRLVNRDMFFILVASFQQKKSVSSQPGDRD